MSVPVTLSVQPFLQALVEAQGSDLHCKVGSPPRIRIDGRLRRLQADALTASARPTPFRVKGPFIQ